MCVLAGAAEPSTTADGETTGSAAATATATAEVQSDNCPVADSRNRMWCCPVPTCNASSHLYCMAVSVHDFKVGQDVAAIRGASKSAYVSVKGVKGAMRDTVEVGKDRSTVVSNKRINEEDAVRRNSAKSLVPSRGTCKACGGSNSWADVVRAVCVKQEHKEVIKGKRKAAEMSSLQKARADEGTGSSDEDWDDAHTAANDVSAERVLSRHDRGSNIPRGKQAVIVLGSDSDEDEDEAGREIMYIDDTSDDEDDVFMTVV